MKLRIAFVSGRETDYIRNRVLVSALRMRYDVAVLTPRIHGTIIRTLVGIASCLASRPAGEVTLAGFFGQPIAVGLSLMRRRPIVLDAYVSTFDTLCNDRRWFPPASPGGRLALWLDRRSCAVASAVITDTQANAAYFRDGIGVPAAKITPIYVGCDEALFRPVTPPARTAREHARRVFYYGAFQPLHGADVIVRAAAALRDRPDIRFTIGGDGPGSRKTRELAAALGLRNVEFPGWISLEQLPAHIAEADICLGGHFSLVPKAARVVSTKTFQFIAMGRPTIVGDNAATRELFTPGEHVAAVPMGDPNALAAAIASLAENGALRARLARQGYELYRERLTTSAISDALAPVIESAACASA